MRFDECLLVVILVKFVVFVSRKDVNMKMPNILMASWFIVLPSRSAITIVCAADCSRYFLDSFVDFGKVIVRNVIEVFGMLLGYYQYMPWIINPPFWSNKCHNVVIFVNYIFKAVVLIGFTSQVRAKWTGVVLWLMVKHVFILPYGGTCEYAGSAIIRLGCQVKTNAAKNHGILPLLSNLAGRESDGWHPLVEDFMLVGQRLERLGFVYNNGDVLIVEGYEAQ